MTERFHHTRDRARALISGLEAAGIRVPAAGRLHRYLRALENAVLTEEAQDPTPAEIAVLHRLLIEVEDFEMIFTLGSKPAVSGWIECTQRAMSGGVLLTDDKTQATARNIQFELVVAALLRAAGFPVRIDEPDLRVHDTQGTFAVAVKRLRSPSKLEARVREARQQVVTSGLPGLIAIDLSCVINPADVAIETANLPAAQRDLEEAGIQFYRTARTSARSRLRHDLVFGLLFYRAQPIFDQTRRTLTYQRHWAVANTLAATHPQTEYLRRILGRLQATTTAG